MPTTVVTLNANTYTDLGTTPCSFQVQGNKPIYMHVGTALPAANTAARVLVSDTQGGRERKIDYASQNVYAKAVSSESTISVVVIR